MSRSRRLAAALADIPAIPDHRQRPRELLAWYGAAIPLAVAPGNVATYPGPNGTVSSPRPWPPGSASAATAREVADRARTLDPATDVPVHHVGKHRTSSKLRVGRQDDGHPSIAPDWLASSRIRAAAAAAFKPVLLERSRAESGAQVERLSPVAARYTVRARLLTSAQGAAFPTNGQSSVSNADALRELATPGDPYQPEMPRPVDWISLREPEAPAKAIERAPRRGRHARSEPFPTFLRKQVSEGDRPELRDLTAALEGWHHRQTGHGVELTDQLRQQLGPRHAASRQELPMGHEEDAARAEGTPVERYVNERDEGAAAVTWPEGGRVSADSSPDHGPIASTTVIKPDGRTRRTPTMPRPAKPRIMAVANQKGGVGKTTTTVNLAAALATYGCRVLVLDLDPQGNASTALGIDHFAGVPSVYEVIIEGKPLAEILRPAEGIDGLFCAPATIDLAGAEIELVALVARESRLARALSSFDQSFDYVLIDCPPSLGLLTVNALVAAEEVLIPIQREYYALEGLGQLLRNVDLVKMHLNPKLRISTIVLTMFDGRTRLAAQVADEVRQHFEGLVLDTTIPRSVRISEAPSYGQTVITYDPVSTAALSYIDAAEELAARGANPNGSAGQSTSWGAP